jgi:nucleotide-binding universal stress UspA family protein
MRRQAPCNGVAIHAANSPAAKGATFDATPQRFQVDASGTLRKFEQGTLDASALTARLVSHTAIKGCGKEGSSHAAGIWSSRSRQFSRVGHHVYRSPPGRDCRHLHVIPHAPAPTLIRGRDIRGGTVDARRDVEAAMTEFKRILVPTDFSEAADRARDIAIDLSKKYGASITLLHCYEVPLYVYSGAPAVPADYWTPIRHAASRRLEVAVAELARRSPETKGMLSQGVPWEQILHAADETKADLIVMGTHGRRGLTHVLLGSVAEKVVRLSPIPVLTVGAAKRAGSAP